MPRTLRPAEEGMIAVSWPLISSAMAFAVLHWRWNAHPIASTVRISSMARSGRASPGQGRAPGFVHPPARRTDDRPGPRPTRCTSVGPTWGNAVRTRAGAVFASTTSVGAPVNAVARLWMIRTTEQRQPHRHDDQPPASTPRAPTGHGHVTASRRSGFPACARSAQRLRLLDIRFVSLKRTCF